MPSLSQPLSNLKPRSLLPATQTISAGWQHPFDALPSLRCERRVRALASVRGRPCAARTPSRLAPNIVGANQHTGTYPRDSSRCAADTQGRGGLGGFRAHNSGALSNRKFEFEFELRLVVRALRSSCARLSRSTTSRAAVRVSRIPYALPSSGSHKQVTGGRTVGPSAARGAPWRRVRR